MKTHSLAPLERAKKTLFCALLCFAPSSLIFSGCTDAFMTLSKKPVIRVDQTELSVSAFAEELASRLRELEAASVKNPIVIKRTKELIVADFIRTALVKKYSLKQNILISEAEVEQETQKFRKNFKDDFQFRESLLKKSQSYAEWREKIRQSLLEKKVIAEISKSIVEPTDTEIEAYYKSNSEQMVQKPRAKLRQAFFFQEDMALRVYKESQKEKDLSRLAQEFSQGAEAKKGGDLGWVERGTLDVFDKAFALHKGQISPVMKSAFGYHIIQVLDKDEGGPRPLGRSKDMIRREIKADREQAVYTQWLEAQLAASKVWRDDELLDSISVDTAQD
ncbi:MAG: peptidylprolyl isomerase [Bdellovibrionales bacterium]|nr:peptidylprolyl isomerase [Bdellovibrionales bacterium]